MMMMQPPAANAPLPPCVRTTAAAGGSSSTRCCRRRARGPAARCSAQQHTQLLPALLQHHSSTTQQPNWMTAAAAAAAATAGAGATDNSSSSSNSSSGRRAAAAARLVHGPLLPAYGGACTLCGGHHLVPCTPDALAAMQALLDELVRHGRLDFASSGPPDPRFSLDYLWTAGPGRMLGVLLAVDADGARHTLRAFSGQMTESWHVPGWVGPVAGITSEAAAYVRTRRVIERLSARLQQVQEQAEPGHGWQQQQQPADPAAAFQQAQRQLLKRRRRALSHSLLRSIQDSYITSTAAVAPDDQQQQQQQQLSLRRVYLSYRQQHDPSLPVTRTRSCRLHGTQEDVLGMPAGAGDCCAIKLLHAAAQQGLWPLGLCEAWCGSAPGTATPAKQGRPPQADEVASRQHARVYGQCDKCTALLGTMLCPGAQAAARSL